MGKIINVMTKLTPEELQQIKELQSKYNQTIFEVGASEAQIIAFQQGIENLQKAKNGLVSDLKTIEQKESELVKSLQEKYGQGNINPETGEITPIQQ
jgi:oligoribonuclease NrnB/cAMP/cGMP phosphodiesterase (DHH superfamily)